MQEVKQNNYGLSISRYKEIGYDEVRHEKPEVILDKVDALEGEIKKSIVELREMLKSSSK